MLLFVFHILKAWQLHAHKGQVRVMIPLANYFSVK